MQKSTTKKFIEKAKLLHGNLYDYSKTIYVHCSEKVIIICKTHGEFEQIPSSHLRPRGCPYCSADSYGPETTEKFISKANLKHNNKYDYSLVQYTGSKIKVTIVCPIHGTFEQKPYTHLYGNGCPGCANYGFDQTKPAYLYYLKVTTNEGKELYKIGITNRTVEARFSIAELKNIEIISQKWYENGSKAYVDEQNLLKLYKEYKYKGAPILNNGNTELFTEDVLSIPNEYWNIN